MALIKIGALWLKNGKSGKFMSGEVEIDGRKYQILVFKNNYKDSDNKPDYIIHLPDDIDGGVHGKEPERNYRERPDPQDQEPDEPSDDIPF